MHCPFLSTTSPPRPPPPPPPRLLHTRNRSQIISSTLRATRQLLSLSSGHLQWPLCRSPPPHLWSGPFSVIATLHAGAPGGRGGSHHSDGAVIPRLASLLPTVVQHSTYRRIRRRIAFISPRRGSAAPPSALSGRHCVITPTPPTPVVEARRWWLSLGEQQRPRWPERVFISERLY